MSIGIKDRIYLQLRIGGIEVPLKDNTIDTIHIVESVRIYVPMMTLVIKDVTKFFTFNNVLVDGASIELTIEAEDARDIYYFKLFNHKEDLSQGILTYSIYGYLDVPRYWTESTMTPIRGTVSSALTKICDATRLKYDGITTADSQLWIPNNRKYSEFAREISEHAWTSDNSCCQMAITADKTMRVRDLSQLLSTAPVQYFSNKENTEEQTIITDYKVVNKAGFFNASTGYKEFRINQSLVSQTTESLKTIKLTKNSSKLMLNQAIQEGVVQNKVQYAPLDVGNVSITYEKALYQNRRLSNLFTFGLEFTTTRQVKAGLLDIINCELAKPDLDGAEAYNGKYLLTTKVIYVVGLNRYVKCEVFRHGLNANSPSQV